MGRTRRTGPLPPSKSPGGSQASWVQAFGRAGLGLAEELFLDLDREPPVVDLDLAVGAQGAIGIDAKRIVLGGVEFDHRAAAHTQEVVDGHARSAELHRDIYFNLVQ